MKSCVHHRLPVACDQRVQTARCKRLEKFAEPEDKKKEGLGAHRYLRTLPFPAPELRQTLSVVRKCKEGSVDSYWKRGTASPHQRERAPQQSWQHLERVAGAPRGAETPRHLAPEMKTRPAAQRGPPFFACFAFAFGGILLAPSKTGKQPILDAKRAAKQQTLRSQPGIRPQRSQQVLVPIRSTHDHFTFPFAKPSPSISSSHSGLISRRRSTL